MISLRLSFVVTILLLATTIAFAQASNEQGIKPYGSYHGGELDQVNLSNGHLELRIPLLEYPQRGGHLKLNFIVRYHNAVWNEKDDCAQGLVFCIHSWGYDQQPGMSVVTEQMFPLINQTDVGNLNSSTPVATFTIKSADESQHPLGNIGGSAYESIDATGMRWDSATQTFTMPDGSRYIESNGSIPILEDVNGNQITFNNGSVITDTMGRSIPWGSSTATQDFSGCTGSSPITLAGLWTVPGANGGTNTFKLCFTQVHIYTAHFGQKSTPTQQYLEVNAQVNMLQSVVLPDGTAWTFEYSQPDANGVNWGDLVKVVLPSGGSISYVWGHVEGCHLPFGALGSWSGSLGERDVDANDGNGPQKWTYLGGQNAGQRIVRDPLNNDTVHTFSDLNSSCSLYETKNEIYNGLQSSGKLVKTVSTEYSWTPNINVRAFGPQNPPPMNVVPFRVTTLWPNGQSKKVEYGYDAGFAFNSDWGPSFAGGTGIYGKEKLRLEYDYGATGTPLRSTATTYWWENPQHASYITYNVLDVPNSVTVQDGAGNPVSQTTITYDEAIPGASGISTSHNLAPMNGNVRGNPTTTSYLLSSSSVATTSCPVSVTNGPISTTKTFLDTGVTSASTDTCKRKSTYQYSPTYAGAYLTQACNPLNQCTSSDFDFNTGSVSSVIDPNGQITGNKTSYTYDGIGRLTGITYPDGGKTNAFYPDATTVEVKKLQDPTAGVWLDSYTYFDGLLRAKQSRLGDPEGDVFSETTYDALGRVSNTTNPHRTVLASTDGSTTKTYDALGRVLTITEPDKNVLQTQYNDPGVVTLIDETGRRRRETFDALGRMVKVEEPTASSSGNQATASVAIGGNLQSITFPPVTAAAGKTTIQITGAERSITINPCAPGPKPAVASPQVIVGGGTNCPQKIQDTGSVNLTVNGHTDTVGYQGGSNTSTVASGLATAINQDASAFISASALNGVLTLTARSTGVNTNYSWTLSSSSSDTTDFGSLGSFSSTSTSGALSGGATGSAGGTVVDAGSITMTVAGYSATVNYGTGLDASAPVIAADLVSNIKSQLPAANPPFTVTLPPGGTTASFAWATSSVDGNNNSVVVTSATSQPATFTSPSFAGCPTTGINPQTCTVALSGGADPFSLDAAPAWTTLYSYNLLGNLLRVEQHGNTTDSTQWRVRTFQYDSLSHLMQSNNPEASQFTFTYDAAGNMVSKKDARGIAVGRSYDSLNRILQETYSDGTPAATFVYDQTTSGDSTLANTIGRLTSTSTGATGTILSYDAMGRLLNEFICLPSNCGSGSYPITAQYDALGHVTALTYPSGRTVSSGYNSAGRVLNSVLTNFAGSTMNYSYYTVPQSASVGSWGYHPNGVLSQGTFGNGITENYGYNDRNQLNAITASAAGQTWLSKIYGLYDSNGKNNGTIWSINDGISPARNQTYKYDDVGRVTSGSQQDGAFSQTFSYDPWGNMTMSGTNNFAPLYDGNNRISGAPAVCTAANTYCYDAVGNLLNDGSHQYSYDGYNRIKAVDGTGATYTYDAEGQRVRKDTGGKATEYINFAGVPIAEKDLATGYWSDYVFFNGHRIGRANNFEHQLHLSGQVCSNCGSQWYQFTLTNLNSLANRTIQPGDTLRWVQWQNAGSSGGMLMSFTDGTDTSGLNIGDQSGEQISRSSVINQWDYRTATLTSLAGKQISQIKLSIDGSTQPGQWDIYIQDLVFVSADGTVLPLFSQNPTVPAMTGAGSSGMTSTSASINDCNGTGCAPVNTTTYFHGDQIGSARLLSAGYGYPVWQGTFTPFGQEVSAEITTNHYKFNGKERGEGTEGGLDYFGARYYSSVQARWMTPDWAETPTAIPYARLANPQSLNLYSFVTDDPLSHTDLDGHFQSAPANQSCPNNNGDACKPFDLPSCPKGATNCTSGSYGGYFEINIDTGTTTVSKSFYVSTTNEDGTTTTTTTTITATFSRTDNGAGQFLGATAASNTSTYDPQKPGSNGPSAETKQAINFSDASKVFRRVGIPLGQVQADSHPDTLQLGMRAIFKNPNTYRNIGDAAIMGVEGGPLGAAWAAGWAVKDLVDAPWGVLTH